MDSRDFLIGRAADPREVKLIRDEIESAPGVDALLDLRTMHVGPDHLIVAARVAFSDEISADRAEDVADDVDRRLADRLPLVPHVFLDPTQASAGLRESVLQARVNRDDAVHAGERDNAGDGLADDDQPHLTAVGPRPPVRGDQGIQPGRIAEPGPGHVDHDHGAPGPPIGRAASSRAACSPAALARSISSGAVTTGTPSTTSTGKLISGTAPPPGPDRSTTDRSDKF